MALSSRRPSPLHLFIVGDVVEWTDWWIAYEANPTTVVRRGTVIEVLLDGVEVMYYHSHLQCLRSVTLNYRTLRTPEPEDEPTPGATL